MSKHKDIDHTTEDVQGHSPEAEDSRHNRIHSFVTDYRLSLTTTELSLEHQIRLNEVKPIAVQPQEDTRLIIPITSYQKTSSNEGDQSRGVVCKWPCLIGAVLVMLAFVGVVTLLLLVGTDSAIYGNAHKFCLYSLYIQYNTAPI